MASRLSPIASVLALVVSSASPLLGFQQESTDAPTVIIVDSLDRAAFANVAELLQARVPGLYIARDGGGGMRWFMRGPASASESAPMVLIDDMRIDMSAPAVEEMGTRPARLDEIDIEEVDRIEIWRGPAGAIRDGTGAGNGVIRIVTFAPKAQPMSFRITTSASTLDENVTYPANATRGGVDTAGRPIRSCSLRAEAADLCTPTGPPRLINVLESDSPFETALGARVAAAVAAGTERLAWRAGASLDREGTTSGTLSAQRLHLRGAATFRPLENLDATLRAHGMRGTADLAAPNEQTLLEQGLFADTAWGGFNRPPTSPYHSTGGGVLVNGRWRPVRWLETRLTSGVSRIIDENDLEYIDGGGIFPLVAVDIRGEQRRRDVTARLDAKARYGGGAVRYASELTIERAVSKQEHEFSEFRGDPGGPFASRAFWLHQRTGIAGVGLLQHLNVADVATIAAGVRFDQARINDRRWDVPFSPHASVTWDIRSLLPRAPGRLKLRAAVARVANVPQTTRPFFAFDPRDPERPKAEVTREGELGLDAMVARDRIRVSATWYTKRTSNVFNLITTIPSFPFFSTLERFEVLNRGVETWVRARIIDAPRVTWDVRAAYAYNHNEVMTSRIPFLIDLGGLGGSGRQWVMPGKPLGAHSSNPLISVRDLDGDGLIDDTCREPITCEAVASSSLEFRPAHPPTSASLETSVRFRALTLSVLLDHRSGHVMSDVTGAARCISQCPALYDPSTSLRDQAEALQVFGNSWPMVKDASFTKLREISLRLEAPTSWARAFGASRMTLSLAGRNLATWTEYPGLDPEASSSPWIPLANMDLVATPLPRRLVIRAELQAR
jgi:outer membrane receptor protein involved in Fe transport